MNKKISIVLGALFIFMIGGVAVAMSDAFREKNYSWRYKMTIAVETPEGLKTGSAVREINLKFVPNPLVGERGNHPYSADLKLKGEAVVVDLGQRGKLFALLKGEAGNQNYSDALMFQVFSGPTSWGVLETAEYYKDKKMGKITLDPLTYPGYPMLVAFEDMSDPKTVQRVLKWKRNTAPRYPETYSLEEDYFEKIFGEGVKLKYITVEVMNEPVTWGVIDKMLPWLKGLNGGYLHGGFTARGAPLGLSGGNFQIDLDR